MTDHSDCEFADGLLFLNYFLYCWLTSYTAMHHVP